MRPALLALVPAGTGTAALAQSDEAPRRDVNRFAIVDAEAGGVDLWARRGSLSALWAGNGTAVWVASCGLGPPAERWYAVRAELPGVYQPFGELREADLQVAPPVRPSAREARGAGVPEGFEAVGDGAGPWAVDPTIDALNVRAGPTTEARVLFEAARGADEVVQLSSCAPRVAGDRGRWCLAEVHPVSDLLDYHGAEARIGFVYTAALVPYTFPEPDGGG